MMYRNGIRILPYGNADDDWLELDKKAFSTTGFILNRQQVIGKVSLSTSHKFLMEQTNREGLIESKEFDALTKLVKWVVDIEFKTFIIKLEEDYKKHITHKKLNQNEITILTNEFQTEIELLSSNIGSTFDDKIKKVKKLAKSICAEASHVLNEVEKQQKKSTKTYEKFEYLAGIGLITEYIFHELDRAVSHTLQLVIEEKFTKSTINVLIEQLTTLLNRIGTYNELSFMKREKKEVINLNELIETVISNHEGEFTRHKIRVSLELPRVPFKIKAVRGMVIQIFENLLVNATYWLKRQLIIEGDNFIPSIQIILEKSEKALYIRDNGPGIQIERKDWIFEPFVTTKPAGLGKGLGLFISRDLAKYHRWTLEADTNYSKIHNGRLNGFVLNMS